MNLRQSLGQKLLTPGPTAELAAELRTAELRAAAASAELRTAAAAPKLAALVAGELVATRGRDVGGSRLPSTLLGKSCYLFFYTLLVYK